MKPRPAPRVKAATGINNLEKELIKRRHLVKYAIPVSGGVMSAHFGHCKQFALIDADEARRNNE